VAAMADGVSLTRAAFDQFHSAGKELRTKKLRTRFEEALESDSKPPGFVPIEIPKDQDDLVRAMKLFENEVCIFKLGSTADHMAQLLSQASDDLHGGGKLNWLKLYIITQTKEFDETTFSKTQEDLWLLKLSVEQKDDEGEIAQPLSFHKRFSVKRGDMCLVYRVQRSP
jgi:hypothetical protein